SRSSIAARPRAASPISARAGRPRTRLRRVPPPSMRIRGCEGNGMLNGKVVLVTGGARGLGAAICRLLAASGAHVIVADVRGQAAGDVAASVSAQGAQAWPLALDVTDAANVEDGVRGAVARFGRLDALVNNAGTDVTCALAELSVGDWERVLRTNLTGPFHMAKAALPYLQRDG